MKKVYWRPRAVSRMALSIIASLSVVGLLLVEFNRATVEQPYYKEKLAASKLAARCMAVIKEERLRRTPEYIDSEVDPTYSGLIGVAISSATSTSGVLLAKQTSINPNFAAVFVEMLKEAGVQKSDTVAVGYSGSFPALNICVEAAAETLELRPIGISSAAASQWGANLPDFLWLDMEKVLRDQGLISFRSVAASLGGVEDRGLGMSEATRATLKKGIERSGLPSIDSADFKDSVDKRMKIYSEQPAGSQVKAYINVGGGTTSVGKSLGKKLLHSGLNRRLPAKARNIDSVMTRFLKRQTPVIHLVRVNDLAQRYGLPVRTELSIDTPQMPNVGEGQVFNRQQYNLWYAGAVLAAILLCLYAFIRSDWGFRIFQTSGRRKDSGHPEPMI